MLEDLIAECIKIKQGNKEFRLGLDDVPSGIWMAEIGNKSPSNILGEVSGEFTANGSSPLEAVHRLCEKIKVR